MNWFNENKNKSYLLSTKEPSTSLRTCTSCCPFDAKNLPHPVFNYSFSDQTKASQNGLITNSDACCLSKLRVDCHIKCRKKKKMKNKRYNSIHSVQSAKRSISSLNRLSPDIKRKKYGSSTNTNSYHIPNYDFNSQTSSSSSLSTVSTSDGSEITQQSLSSNRSKNKYRYHNKSANAQEYFKRGQSSLHLNENIKDLKTSIDNLAQLIVHQQKPGSLAVLSPRSFSLIDKVRQFFTLFKSLSSKPSEEIVNEECSQILERNHLSKQNLLSIYHLFDKNETIFLNWLRTIMPEYFLPLLLNYVKHFDSIPTDNE